MSNYFAFIVGIGLVIQKIHEQGAIESVPFLLAVVITAIAALAKFSSDIKKESREYARKLDPRRGSSLQTPEISKLLSRIQVANSRQIREAVENLRAEIEKPEPEFDTSTPDTLFNASRQRLLDEAVRIDSISRRNLVLGVLFSTIALGFLAWPLIAQSLLAPATATPDATVLPWVAQYYLPRFAVGIILQFVGFFFLRLYVANEFDLKHNKNEITNIELKMMALQLARIFDDASSKKEVMKSLAQTERNFILKRNEKSVSIEALSEYNDIKSLLEKVVNKLPTGK